LRRTYWLSSMVSNCKQIYSRPASLNSDTANGATSFSK
jgi:hypothetical protein